jgi:hypothetical protein
MFPSARVAAMNTKQMAVLTAAVVALVVIVTLIKVGLGGRGMTATPLKGGAAVLTVPHLTFPRTELPTKWYDGKGPPPEEEIGSEGACDFWFVNEKDAPVEVFLAEVGCGRCTAVKIGLAPQGLQEAQVAAAIGLGQTGALAGAPQAASIPPEPGPEVAWEILEAQDAKPDAKGFTVPPGRKGWVHLGWRDQDAGPKRVTAKLRTSSPIGSAPMVTLQIQAMFGEAIRVWPSKKELTVETFVIGDERPREALFTVYSSTRKKFRLELDADAARKAGPFVSCGQPVPLIERECRDLEKDCAHAVLSGYKIPVTVRSRVEGREHDLGPFRSTMAVKTDVLPDDIGLTVLGNVRGPVTILAGGAETEEDRITFGAFPRNIGSTKTVTVEAQPGVKVALEDTSLDFLEAPQLEPEPQGKDSKQRWSLKLTIKPNVLSGPFGHPGDSRPDTAIYLTANGRRVRIPVSGAAKH